MFEQLKRSYYIKYGYKEKDFIIGSPVSISVLKDWSDKEYDLSQSSYLAFPNKWRRRPDILLLEEQNFMLLLVTVINKIFDNPNVREPEMEFVSRFGYHMLVSFKKNHKKVQICDVEAVTIFLCRSMLMLTKNKYRIRVIFAEKQLAVHHFKEILG